MVKSRYNESVTVKRNTGGSQDPETKRLTVGSVEVIYSGRANFQEMSENDKLSFKNLDEGSARSVEFKMWLPVFLHKSITIGDTVEVTFPDGKEILCSVSGKNRTSEAIHCEFVTELN